MDYKNQDVPMETYVKCLLRRNHQLELKVLELQAELDAKKEAIRAFKKWQSKVAQYKFEYWTNEALEFLGESAPERENLKKLKTVLGNKKIVDAETTKLIDYIRKKRDGFDEETSREIWCVLNAFKKKEGA
jgi:hypothetical protein